MKKILKKIPGFSELTDDILDLVVKVLDSVSYKQGENLCVDGETGDRMFLIQKGKVSVLKHVEGEEVEVAVLQNGDIAGEMGLFGQKGRTATLKAKTDCQAYALHYAVFEALMEQYPVLSRGLLTYVSAHLARETSIVAKLLAKDIEKGLHIAFFHCTPYRNQLYTANNEYNYVMRFFTPRLTQETVSLAAGNQVIVVSANDCLDRPVIEELHALGVEMIAMRCAGTNNVDLKTCEEKGITVARVPAYSPHAIAEHAIALIMGLNRRTHRAHARVREGNFSLDGLVGFDLFGKTAGVVGTGRIGACLLRILSGFGCDLLAFDLYPNTELAEEVGIRYVDLDTIYRESDLISLHAPSTKETYHMIDAQSVAKNETWRDVHQYCQGWVGRHRGID